MFGLVKNVELKKEQLFIKKDKNIVLVNVFLKFIKKN